MQAHGTLNEDTAASQKTRHEPNQRLETCRRGKARERNTEGFNTFKMFMYRPPNTETLETNTPDYPDGMACSLHPIFMYAATKKILRQISGISAKTHRPPPLVKVTNDCLQSTTADATTAAACQAGQHKMHLTPPLPPPARNACTAFSRSLS